MFVYSRLVFPPSSLSPEISICAVVLEILLDDLNCLQKTATYAC